MNGQCFSFILFDSLTMTLTSLPDVTSQFTDNLFDFVSVFGQHLQTDDLDGYNFP